MNNLAERYLKTDLLPTLFCPGCGNGTIQYAMISAMDKLGIKDNLACVSGIGCSAWIPCYLKADVMHTTHGRALAFAQGIKLAQPDKKVVVFTGDGDCLAIGGNHLLHAAARNIDLTVVMVNNYIYGMTGGQKSPTTPKGSVTKTSPFGAFDEPVKGCEMAMAMGATYCARWTTAHPVQLEKAICEGIKHKGLSFIEVLSQCPVQAGKSVFGEKEPAAILKKIKESTYIRKAGEEPEADKIRIGLLKHDNDTEEYTEKLRRICWTMMDKEVKKEGRKK